MILSKLQRGDLFQIIEISNQQIKAQLIRMGLAEGAIATCYEVIPGGPIIVQKNFQEIALGRHIANGIEVVLKSSEDIGG